MLGQDGNDRLFGVSGIAQIYGGAGNDRLEGGSGADQLFGGAGADSFRFTSIADGHDRIRDFASAQHDVIDLSRIDANAKAAGDQGFHFVKAFAHHAGEAVLSYDAGRDITTLRLDDDGDAKADMVLTLDGHIGQSAGWVL
jgi:serralysin